jgi:adenylate kinase family enzyme
VSRSTKSSSGRRNRNADIQRVSVVGCSGSGKTTLARSLAGALGAPFIELDALFHQPGWVALDSDTFRARTLEATASTCWVTDGNYSAVRGLIWERADTVVWFDLPYAVVMARTIRRTVRRTVTRQELWNGNREPWSNLFSWKPEKSIIAWSATRHGVYRQRYGEAAHDPRWAGLEFVHLRSQREADSFLAGVVAGRPKGE